ncbi:protein of unknown function [Rhodovastum atsumiense]|nr:protein of unknown function [Rhodovastum atsumiense]
MRWILESSMPANLSVKVNYRHIT